MPKTQATNRHLQRRRRQRRRRQRRRRQRRRRQRRRPKKRAPLHETHEREYSLQPQAQNIIEMLDESFRDRALLSLSDMNAGEVRSALHCTKGHNRSRAQTNSHRVAVAAPQQLSLIHI